MDTTNDTFTDFIPAGSDTGAITEDGFRDFVPAPEPQLQQVENTVEETSEPVADVPQEEVVEDAPVEEVETPVPHIYVAKEETVENEDLVPETDEEIAENG